MSALLTSKPTIFVRSGLSVCFFQEWLSASDSRQLLHRLRADMEWMQGEIRLFGSFIDEPRLTAWSGDVPYTYSKRTLETRSWHPQLVELRRSLEALLETLRISTPQGLNHCLLNYYRSGRDSMGWHRDNESELGRQPVIVSLSLGEPRRFRLRQKYDDTSAPLTFELGDGNLLIMYGTTQTFWEHALLKSRKDLGPRMNLTFRSVVV